MPVAVVAACSPMLANPVPTRPCAMCTTEGARLRPTNPVKNASLPPWLLNVPRPANMAMSKGATARRVCQPYHVRGPRRPVSDDAGCAYAGGGQTATYAVGGGGTGWAYGGGHGGADWGYAGAGACARAGAAASKAAAVRVRASQGAGEERFILKRHPS